MDIFDLTDRPAESLFAGRNDANDQKYGEFVRRDPAEFPAARVVILGCPQDEGVRRNQGRAGASEGPKAIRRAFYRFSVPAKAKTKMIFDLGDVKLLQSLEKSHALQAEIVANVLKENKKLIVLGGGNDISYPDVVGLSQVTKHILAFNIDSHYDVRADEARNSGTPYRQLLEEGYLDPAYFFEMATKPIVNSASYQEYLQKKGVQIFSLENLRREGVDAIFQKILIENDAEVVVWGIDLDAVCSADAPGVSASYPQGLSADEICKIAEIAGKEKRSKILEISEMNPVYDIDNRTARLAAMIMSYFLNS